MNTHFNDPASAFDSTNSQDYPKTQLNKHQLVEMILALDLSIGNVEQQAKELRKQLAIAEYQLCQKMEDEDLQSFTTEDGRKVTRNDKLFVTIRKDKRREWFEWLEEIGRGDVIQEVANARTVNSLVKKVIKGEENWPMPEFLDQERDIFYKPHVDIKMGAKSLRKMATDAGRDEGEE